MRRLPVVIAAIAAIAGLAVAGLPALAAKTIIKRGYIPGGVPDLPCTIQIDFTSGSADLSPAAEPGPDYNAFGSFHRYAIDTRDVDDAEAWGWGKHGEFSLCFMVHDPKEAVIILADLTKLATAKPGSSGGPVVVKRGASWK
ncbi:MAG: hypothetical protein SH859_06145 [Hyphomicrobium aestuarii]|nr:hypothetical protein [Hyphomicrobium aestuarii]